MTRSLVAIEARRLALPSTQDEGRTHAQRNRLGQFATLGPLVAELLRYAHQLFGAGPLRFLDPAIGTGAFYSALLREWPAASIAAATGFEIDPHYARPCFALWRGTPVLLRAEDFTAAVPPSAEAERYDLAICNVRHHHLGRAGKTG